MPISHAVRETQSKFLSALLFCLTETTAAANGPTAIRVGADNITIAPTIPERDLSGEQEYI